ncbi:MAG: efflux RND transporter periplasmic adaptor subunit [Chitinophagaceae bacterium]|nr:efflux RND transporter periplasmic adaptor subunit [Chitinophagaceae bacterium]
MKNKNQLLKLLLCFYISISIISCKNKIEDENNSTATKENTSIEKNENIVELTDAQLQNAELNFTNLELKEVAEILKVNGKIDVPPQNMISISVPLGGYLKRTSLLPGSHVSKGEILATVEDQQYIQIQQDYLTAKTQLNLLYKDFKRQQELNQSKATSDKIFEQAKAAYLSQQILVNSFQEKLNLVHIPTKNLNANSIQKSISIYSPIDGFVSKVNVNIGKYVSPTDVLFELVNPSDIHLNLNIFEKDIAKLNIGQRIYAYSNSNPTKKYLCEIILISKDVSSNGTTEVHCHFSEYDKTLIPGMYMNAEIELRNSISNVLPEDAIINFENNNYVFVQNTKNKFEFKTILLGNNENGWHEVLQPQLFNSKNIVTKGAYTLFMKMKNTEEEE